MSAERVYGCMCEGGVSAERVYGCMYEGGMSAERAYGCMCEVVQETVLTFAHI